MNKQLETPAEVESAKADYIATGSAEALARYEAALQAWLQPRPPVKPGSWEWQRRAEPRRKAAGE